jgi:hypothetical protein
MDGMGLPVEKASSPAFTGLLAARRDPGRSQAYQEFHIAPRRFDRFEAPWPSAAWPAETFSNNAPYL